MNVLVLTPGYRSPLRPGALRVGPPSIDANVIQSGCCEGVMSNGVVVLSLLAIASPKRIREISDRTNWKITMREGGQGGGLYQQQLLFFLLFFISAGTLL